MVVVGTCADLNGETCESLGHGSGTLGCAVDCTWDFSGCEIGNSQGGSASACGSYSILKLQLGHMTAPAGDEDATLKGTGLSGSGRSGFEARPASGTPTRYIFRDRSRTHGGITKITLRAVTGAGFGGPFRIVAKVRNVLENRTAIVRRMPSASDGRRRPSPPSSWIFARARDRTMRTLPRRCPHRRHKTA